MKYTTSDKVLDYLLITLENETYLNAIDGFIDSMSRHMDTLCDRKLVADEEESDPSGETKYYDGNGKAKLFIDDCQEIISVETGDQYGENLISTDDFIPYPKVAPIHALVSKGSGFPSGIQNIAVTGRFGLFAEVPADIEFACTVLVGGIIINQTLPTQAKTSERIGNYSVSYRDDKEKADFARAMETISRYTKMSL